MIIPVRCFGCGKVLADKWDGYVRLCEASDASPVPSISPATPASAAEKTSRTAQGKALDALGVRDMCCRTVMLTHVDLSHVI